jgi:hypothetical protein
MREYVENLISNIVPLNNGYAYIATESVAIPVHKVSLGISKRRTTNLELVEEMVLKFVEIGISDIDTIAEALRLPRDILDITIGDLHVKNLAFHSSGKCILTAKGKAALKSLAISKREKDVLRNIYVNAVTGEIYGEKDRDYTQSRVQNDIKVKHKIDANELSLYRRNMSEINQIFEQSAKTYLEDNMKVQDELASVDTVDDLTTGFVIVPIHIYGSEKGLDIDIVARNRWQKILVDDHKEIIIEQMRERKLLSNLFIAKKDIPSVSNKKTDQLQGNYYQSLKSLLSVDNPDEFSTRSQEVVFGTRRLIDNELLDFCNLIFGTASTIEMQVDNLIYWSKNSMFLTMGSFISQKPLCSIIYAYSHSPNEISSSVRRIRGSCPNIPQKAITKGEHTALFRIIIDSKFQIDVAYELANVFTEECYIPKIVAHLSEFVAS